VPQGMVLMRFPKTFLQNIPNLKIVDLTHTFFPGQPHAAGLPDQRVRRVEAGVGNLSLVHEYCIVGQWGTHIDAPLHFRADGVSLEQLPVDQCVLPLAVLDIHGRVRIDPDAVPTLGDVSAWESAHGPIPEGSFVALRTDWSLRWPDSAAMENVGVDGLAHRPGWSSEVLQFLVDERNIAAIGHETADTDRGCSVSELGDFPLERYFLGTGRWQIELLTNLWQLPESSAVIFAGWPKPQGSPGFPVRAVALFIADTVPSGPDGNQLL
jgi:kynurenine formamidase